MSLAEEDPKLLQLLDAVPKARPLPPKAVKEEPMDMVDDAFAQMQQDFDRIRQGPP